MFVTAYNFNNVSPKVVQEKVSDEVLIEPFGSYTVRELVYRLAMGMGVSSGIFSGDYPDEDQDFDDVLPTEDSDFDLVDYAALKADIAERDRQREIYMQEAYREKLAKEKKSGSDPGPDPGPDPAE